MKPPSELERAVRALRSPLAAMAIIGIFVNLTLLVPPLYMLQVYDRVLASGNVGTLAMLTLIALVMLAVYGVLEFVRLGILVRTGHQFGAMVSQPLFRWLSERVDRDGLSFGSRSLADVATLRDTLASSAIAALSDIPWTPVYIALCWLVHPTLGAVALGATIAILSVALLTEALTRSLVHASSQATAEASQVATATLQNSDVVRALGMKDAVFSRWSDAQASLCASQSLASERAAMTLALSKFVRLLVQSLMLGTGAWLAIQNEISPGLMIASSIIMTRALSPVEQVVGNWRRLIGARAAYERLRRVFASLPTQTVATQLPEPSGRLAVEDLTIIPPGARQASVLKVDFSFEAGTALAIVGRSGSGKSSLAKAIAGVWPAAKGTVRLDGAALDQYDTQELGRYIGYVPQTVALFDGTVGENIARLNPDASRGVIDAAKLAGVHDAILRLPDGYDTLIGERGITLSGGMTQRIALARAVFGSPRLVVLDEPNANLDVEGDTALTQSVQALKAAGVSIVIVTHKPQLLAHVDQVLVLHDGLVRAMQPRDQILKPTGSRVSATPAPQRRAASSVAA